MGLLKNNEVALKPPSTPLLCSSGGNYPHATAIMNYKLTSTDIYYPPCCFATLLSSELTRTPSYTNSKFPGRPPPTVRWWRGEVLLDSKDEVGEFPDLRRNTLVIPKLVRQDLHAVFTCQASNNNISQPVSASIAIEMHCKYLIHFF